MLPWLLALVLSAPPTLHVSNFGVVADGRTDDGPALCRAVDALAAAPPGARLVFPPARTLRLVEAPRTWVIELLGARNVTIDGQGCVLLLGPQRRAIHLRDCQGVRVENLSIDFDPLPFADGLVVGVDAAAGWIDVRIAAGFAVPPLGGPTGDREQAYFGMLWHPGPFDRVHEHYFIADSRTAGDDPRVLRVWRQPGGDWSRLQPGVTRISLPVRGIAHRMEGFGASPAIVIEENRDIALADVNLWSAPLFGVNVARNRGLVSFTRVHIEPRPGTQRLTSAWRDGFHCKGNYAALRFEDCRISGTNDDAFNLATHSSRVTAVHSRSEVTISQTFPLGFVPFEPGDQVGGFSVGEGRLLANARVVAAAEQAPRDLANLDRPAVPLRLELDQPMPGIAVGDVFWNVSSANPRTLLRGCTIANACRLQSPVTMERCTVTALLWCYGDALEGPLPRDLVLRENHLRVGRGNDELVLSVESHMSGPDGQPARMREPVIHGVQLLDNVIEGLVRLRDCAEVVERGNRYVVPRGRLEVPTP